MPTAPTRPCDAPEDAPEKIDRSRRRLLGASVVLGAGVELGAKAQAQPQAGKGAPASQRPTAFAPLKQVDAGLLLPQEAPQAFAQAIIDVGQA